MKMMIFKFRAESERDWNVELGLRGGSRPARAKSVHGL